MRTWLIVAAACCAAAAASAAPAGTVAARCTGAQLHGAFTAVPGSAGAGNIVYRLTLKNTSTSTCTVTGLPQGTLLGRRHNPLPTHVTAAHPGLLTAVLVTLAPGKSTTARARFSPDVPGQGEPVSGRRCEPTSYWFRVRGQGGGTTVVPVKPPTPVCEHGGLQFDAYSVPAA
jgi:Protein of unknown function (DUF4232)